MRLIAYGADSVTYDIKFWMRDFERFVETRDAVLTSVWYQTRRAGLLGRIRSLFGLGA